MTDIEELEKWISWALPTDSNSKIEKNRELARKELRALIAAKTTEARINELAMVKGDGYLGWLISPGQGEYDAQDLIDRVGPVIDRRIAELESEKTNE